MKDVLGLIQTLRRPPLLIRAARIGQDHYQRDRHLPRLLRGAAPARSGEAAMQLLGLEAELESKRRTQDASYSVARHVDVLVALMAEAQILRQI